MQPKRWGIVGAIAVVAAVVLGLHHTAAQEASVVPLLLDPAAAPRPPAEAGIAGIRFITTDDYPPFNFTDATGRLTGFNVDLARAVCAAIDLPCTVQARPWDDLIPALTEGRADAAIAGIAVSEATRTAVAFSDVYLPTPGRFAARRDVPIAISAISLAGRTIGVVSGTAHEAYVAAYFGRANIQPFPTMAAAETALRFGGADVLFGDGITIAFWLQGEDAADCCALVGGPYLDSHFFGEGFAIALAPGNVGLNDSVNAALQAVVASGAFAELYLRYFPVGFF